MTAQKSAAATCDNAGWSHITPTLPRAASFRVASFRRNARMKQIVMVRWQADGRFVQRNPILLVAGQKLDGGDPFVMAELSRKYRHVVKPV